MPQLSVDEPKMVKKIVVKVEIFTQDPPRTLQGDSKVGQE